VSASSCRTMHPAAARQTAANRQRAREILAAARTHMRDSFPVATRITNAALASTDSPAVPTNAHPGAPARRRPRVLDMTRVPAGRVTTRTVAQGYVRDATAW
jgi:hypothetical protein